MADNKVKTKTAILQELESIKGLLFEQDDIPILQEVIDENGELASPQEALDQEDLDALHEAFQTLKHTIVRASESSAPTDDALQQDEPLNNETQPQNPISAAQQAPLFDEEPEEVSASIEDTQDELPASSADYSTDKSPDHLIEEPIPFYGNHQHDDEVSSKPTHKTSKPLSGRPHTTTPKDSGENPFLPQHIRARLHGNNPPPLFDTTNVSTNRSRKTSLFGAEGGHSSARQDLIRELLDKVMPHIEQDLRQRLQAMTDDELQKLR